MVKTGCQQPTFERVGEYDESSGLYAIDVITDMGATFMPYQKHEFCLFMARNKYGDFASRSICISVPRQNGKSYAARWYAIWMAAVEGQNVLYSCHHSKVARSMFKKIEDAINACQDLRECLKPNGQGIYRAAGNEGIYFADPDTGLSRGMIEFQTRMSGNVRGESYSVIVVDEAQELTEAQAEGMTPTRLAQADPQTIYIGTPTPPESNGTVFRRIHDAAHDGAGRAWWVEWAADSIIDTSDTEKVLEVAYRTNPAMGILIKEDVMLDTIESMGDDGVARELFGWWSKHDKVNTAISVHDWDACGTDGMPGAGGRHFAVKFSPDGAFVSLSVCVADDKPYLNVIDRHSMRDGTQWLADWLTLRADDCESITIDGTSSQYLIEKLDANGVDKSKIITPRSSDMSDACDMLNNALVEHGFVHFNQTSVRDAVMVSRRRNIGRDGWGFAGDGADMLESIALAHRAALVKRKPRTRMMVAF